MHVALCDVGPMTAPTTQVGLEPAVRAELSDRLAAPGLRASSAAASSTRRSCRRWPAPRRCSPGCTASTASSTPRALDGRGVERAVAAGADEVHLATRSRTRSAPATRTPRSGGRGRAEEMIAAAHAAGVRASVTLGASFGCPSKGRSTRGARDRARRAHGARRAQTRSCSPTRSASACRIRALCSYPPRCPRPAVIPIGLHLHNTRNTGYANADAGIESGATLFDASIGGLGGCPSRPARPATSQPRISSTCSMGSASRRALTSRRSSPVAEWLAGALAGTPRASSTRPVHSSRPAQSVSATIEQLLDELRVALGAQRATGARLRARRGLPGRTRVARPGHREPPTATPRI